MMIKKSLYILCALLLSSAVHIEAMQDDYNNDQLPSQNDKKQTLNKIHNIIDKFQINKAEKEKILHNISEINDEYELYWTYEVLHESLIFQKGEKIAEILLKIIQYTNKNNINTLKETQSLFSNLQGYGEPGDLFFKIGKNIKDMDEEQLYALSRVLDILPEEAKTEDILFFIIGMDEYMLVNLYLLLCSLPENEKTKEILLNMSKMDTEILSFDFFIILCSLSSKELTQDKILNISRMDKDELRDLRFGIDCDEILEIY